MCSFHWTMMHESVPFIHIMAHKSVPFTHIMAHKSVIFGEWAWVPGLRLQRDSLHGSIP